MPRTPQSSTERKLRRYMDTLRRQLPMLRTRFHVQYLGVFGSYVQGTPRKDSDLDMLVDFTDGCKSRSDHEGHAQAPDRTTDSQQGRGPVTHKREFLDYLADIQDAAVE